MTDNYLRNNFTYNGEAYWKGAGHILRENFPKGLFFIISRQLLPATFIFGLVFSMTDNTARKEFFRFINFIAIVTLILTLLYVLFKLIEVYNHNHKDQLFRIVEIALFWLLKVVGFYLGYNLTKLIF